MDKITAFASMLHKLYKRMPFLLRRAILAYAFAAVWLLGGILQHEGYDAIGMPLLIGGAIGASWAASLHKFASFSNVIGQRGGLKRGCAACPSGTPHTKVRIYGNNRMRLVSSFGTTRPPMQRGRAN